MWKRPLSLALIGVGLASEPALAWSFTGHMITAQIAYDRLTPKAKAESDRLIALLKDAEPGIGHFVPASIWMDTLHWTKLSAFGHWHYINWPYNPYGLPVPKPDTDNVIWAVKEAQKTLSHSEAGDFQKALMLRALIHTVGDIHQPMHAVSRISIQHPQGDQGGNLFLLKGPSRNLHAFWDAMGNKYPRLKYEQWQQFIPGFTQEVTKEVPFDEQMLKVMNPRLWAQESYSIGVDQAYQNISQGAEPSKAYVAAAQKVCTERVAVGGYRLSAILNRLFK